MRERRLDAHGCTDTTPASAASLVADLRRLGVVSGDTIMVHASLRALGPTEGRAAGLIQALDEAVGPSGTTLMVLGARDDWAWVNNRPESERPGLLADATPFDCHLTPAESDVGALAEVFRVTPGTLVSDHPEGRFAARGHLAGHFVDDVPWDDYYGPGSPLQRLTDARGKVLRLGADPNTVTLIHYAEYLAAVPRKRRVRRHRRVAGPQGPAIRIVDSLDDCDGIVDFTGEDYFTLVLQQFFDTHASQRGLVGRARSELIDARALVDFASVWLSEHLTPGPSKEIHGADRS